MRILPLLQVATDTHIPLAIWQAMDNIHCVSVAAESDVLLLLNVTCIVTCSCMP